MRSLSASLGWADVGAPAFALGGDTSAVSAARVLLARERARRAGPTFGFLSRIPRGAGLAFSAALILAAGGFGAVRGGRYAEFVASEGGVGDFVARQVGFGVDVVTISGIARLGEREVLGLAGVTPRSSVPFFDVDDARARLEKAPLVQSASVRKLYPNRILIDVVERSPAALWQRNGEVSMVAADGAALDLLRDSRLNDLPFVVGDGANGRLREYLQLLVAAEELKPRIEAGVFVGQRRWNLRMKTGVDVKLSESDPVASMRVLVKLERASRILERDILSLDLRDPGRAFVRLSADAADARAQAQAAKGKKGEKP